MILPITSGETMESIPIRSVRGFTRQSGGFGLGGADNVVFDMTGNMWDPRTREYLGSLTEGAN
jgi:hypothetical protein